MLAAVGALRPLAARARRPRRRPGRDPDAELLRLPRDCSSPARCSASRSSRSTSASGPTSSSYVLDDSDMVAIVTNDLIDGARRPRSAHRRRGAERPPCLRHLIALGATARPPGSSAATRSSRPDDDVPVAEVHEARRRVRLRDEAMMMYTSGTTTNPKGCVLTHEALVRTGVAAAERWQLVHDERFWNPLPMFHMGQVFPLLAHMHVGATLVTSHAVRRRRGAAADRGGADHLRVPDLPGDHAGPHPAPRLRAHEPAARSASSTTRARPRRCARCRSSFAAGAGRDPVRHDRDLRRHLLERARRPVREADDDRRPAAARRRRQDRRPRDRRGAAGRRARRDHRPRRPGCSSATTTTPRRRPTRCAAAGSTPATSAGSTTTGG